MSSVLISFTSDVADYLLYASIIAVILVAIALVIFKLGKIHAPVYHHMIWLCTLFAVLILPLIWLYAPKVPFAILPAQYQTDIVLTQEADIQSNTVLGENRPSEIQSSGKAAMNSSGNIFQNPLRLIPVKNILVFLWTIGLIFMLVRLLISWHRINRIVRSAKPISVNILPALSYGYEEAQPPSPRRPVRHRLGEGGRLKLLLSRDVDSPLCFGILRPVILLPKRMYSNTISIDLRMVLCHELAHIERKDCFVNIFQRLVEAIFFFHPFVWYASSQLTQNREILCDHHVIAKGVSPTDYVRLLTRIVENGIEKNNLHAVALFEGRLLSRVRSLLGSGNKIRLKTSRWAMSIGIMISCFCMASGAIRLEARAIIVEDQTASTESVGDNQDAVSFLQQEEILASRYKHPISNSSSRGEVASAEIGEPMGSASVSLFNTADDSPVAEDGLYLSDDLDRHPVYAVVWDTNHEEKDQSLTLGYHPGAISKDEAKVIYFNNVKSLEDIDIRLTEKGEYILEGFVADKDTGNPVQKTLITIQYSDMYFAKTATYTDEQGYYRIDSMAAGDFLVHMDAEPWGYVRTRKALNIDTGTKTTRLDFALRPAATISGQFVDEYGEPIDITSYNYGIAMAYTYGNQISESTTSWYSSLYPINKYAVKDHQGEFFSGNHFENGEGDYTREDMLFPTPETFIIQGVLPGRTSLFFELDEECYFVKQILYNGEDIMGATIETSPGERIEDVFIVIGTADKDEIEVQKSDAEKSSGNNYMRSFLDYKYDSLFNELNLPSDILEDFKDVLVDEIKAYQKIYSERPGSATDDEKTALIKRHDEVHREYIAKVNELLGEEDYEKYYKYNERWGSRYFVTGFMESLSLYERLTEYQEQELIDIIYQEQMKIFYESGYDTIKTLEFDPDLIESKAEYLRKNMQKIHSRTLEKARETLSAYQLEQFKEYLKKVGDEYRLYMK